jgi:predicted RNA-binding protein Jag
MENNIAKVRKYFDLKEDRKEFSVLSKEEKDLVALGHKIVKVYEMQKSNTIQDPIKKANFKSMLGSVETVDNYDELNRKYMLALCKYAASKTGADVTNFTIDAVKNPNLTNRGIYKETFQAVISQVLTPVVPALVSAAFIDMADVSNVGFGDNGIFQVRSNDTFYVTHTAEGVLSGTVQRLYNKELTIQASDYSIKTAVDWYQVASGIYDFGYFIDRIGQSFAAYISTMVVQAITADIAANITKSTPYFTNGFTTPKWSTLVDRLSAANGGADISAFGTLSALSPVIPTQAGLQQGLGQEWTKVGYLSTYFGVNLVRIPEVLLPNTVNTTALFGIPNDTVYLFANGGYKPVKLLFEGTAVTNETAPNESSDKELGLEVTMKIGQGFVAASKYGAITGMTLA